MITEKNFDEFLNQNEKPVLIDFYADWCGPCQVIKPIIDELANDFKDKAIIGKVDVDESAELANKFGVRSIPTLLLIKNGEVVERKVGVVPKAELADLLNRLAS